MLMRWWQRVISNFTEVPIESTSSHLHRHLEVSIVRGRYQLATDHSIYSFDDLYLNFFKAFHQLSLPADHSDVLVLGLGLASIPWMLERNFHRQYNYVAVEIDEEVIRLASKYRLRQLQSPLQVHCADAVRFAKMDSRVYDLICVDVFIDDLVPQSLEDPEVIRTLQTKLSQGGILLWNRLFRSGQDKMKTESFYHGPFTEVFGAKASRLDVDGNWILVGKA